MNDIDALLRGSNFIKIYACFHKPYPLPYQETEEKLSWSKSIMWCMTSEYKCLVIIKLSFGFSQFRHGRNSLDETTWNCERFFSSRSVLILRTNLGVLHTSTLTGQLLLWIYVLPVSPGPPLAWTVTSSLWSQDRQWRPSICSFVTFTSCLEVCLSTRFQWWTNQSLTRSLRLLRLQCRLLLLGSSSIPNMPLLPQEHTPVPVHLTRTPATRTQIPRIQLG